MVAVIQQAWQIREMGRADLKQVMQIEASAYPFPWTRGIFADCLRVGYFCRVADVAGQILGYSIASVAAGEAHLLNLCVAVGVRRQGIGQRLLSSVMDEVSLHGALRLFLEVRPSNPAALKMYQSSGFRVIGRRPGYYPSDQGREDAMVMVRHLDEAAVRSDPV